MIIKMMLRSNGQLLGYDEQGTRILSTNLLDTQMHDLYEKGIINVNTELFIPLSNEPIKIKDWFDFGDQAKKEIDEIDKVR